MTIQTYERFGKIFLPLFSLALFISVFLSFSSKDAFLFVPYFILRIFLSFRLINMNSNKPKTIKLEYIKNHRRK